MISRAIELARHSELFSRIVVSTDDFEIAKIANASGGEVPFMRPMDISNDTATTVSVISHAVRQLQIEDGVSICCLYPSTPLLRPIHLSDGLNLMMRNPSLHYVAAVQRHDYPLQRRLITNDGITYSMENPENLLKPTQSFDTYWHDAGQFYWGMSQNWREEKPLLINTGGIVVKPWEAWDIDTIEDWKLAELLYSAINNKPVL
jgi:pseudaminic acid cytidylyltransferase